MGSPKKTTEDFIKEARRIHGGKYDYSHTIYEGRRKQLEIICPIHGSFLQTPDVHYKCDCPLCGWDHASKTKTITKNGDILHGIKYISIDKIEPHNNRKIRYWKVECTKCGCIFTSVPDYTNSYLRCPRCKGIPRGASGLSLLWKRYRKAAEKRNVPFDLDIEIFREMTSKPCYYCGTEPYTIIKTGREWNHYRYNGVDRIDNELGYNLSNCVPCCWQCNRAKGRKHIKDFMLWITLVYNNHYNITAANLKQDDGNKDT